MNNGYQQVPQHLQPSQSNSSSATNSNLLNMPPPTTATSTPEHPTQPLQNTSNYLLMPAPQNNAALSNNPAGSSSAGNSNATANANTTTANSAINGNSSGNSGSNMTRSHSYHAGVSQQSYDVSNSNSSNVYVDVYHNGGQCNGSSANNPNVPNILPGTVNPHNTLLMQAGNNGGNSNAAIGNTSGLENINNVYGSSNFHG